MLTDSGVEVVEGANVAKVTASGVVTAQSTGSEKIEADAVLFAVGRVPVVPAGLDLAGVGLDERGFIEVDAQLRTSADHVCAVGDVNGGPQFTHISLDDHRIVASQLLGGEPRSTNDRVAVPVTTFVTPPFARVGITEGEAAERGLHVKVATRPVANLAMVPRPKTLGQTAGLVKVVVDAETDQVLGFAQHGVDAQEVVNTAALAMRTGTTATQLRNSIWLHLSTTELLNEIFDLG